MKTPADLNLSPKYRQQLERARHRGSSEFFTNVIIATIEAAQNGQIPGYPHLFHRTDGSFSDVEMGEILEAAVDDGGETDISSAIAATELFTNPLGVADYDASRRVPGKLSGWTPPNQRVVNAGWMVLTYEFDGIDRTDLEMQLDWFAGKVENCRFATVHRALSDYADYRGYCAVFSGHKSVHIHTLWDIRHLAKDLIRSAPRSVQKLWDGDVPDRDLIGLHRIVWAEVAGTINQQLGTSITFDPRLQSYLQKRRSPGGIRRITKDMPLHGFVAGDDIEQIVLQERISTRTLAPAKSPAMINFAKSRSITRCNRDARRNPSRRAVVPDKSDEIVALLQTYLREHGWDEYPKPVGVEFDGTNNMVFFKNNPADMHPSTLVRGDFRRLLGAGRGAPSSDLFLPNDLTLDESLDLLAPPNTSFVPVQSQRTRGQLPLGQNRFPMKAKDKGSARIEASRIIQQAAQAPGVVLVQAAEGTGKTHALFASLVEQRWDDDAERYHTAMERGVEPTSFKGPTIIACSSYFQIEEKRDELLNLDNAPASVVVLHSVSFLYKTALSDFKGIMPLTNAEAGNLGFQHRLQAIQATQPDVYSRMKELRDDAWRSRDGQVRFRDDAVVIMVHDLIKVWPHAEFTKAFLHPDFSDDFDLSNVRKYSQRMQPYRVIYDEVAWHDLATVVPEARVQLAWSIRDACFAATGKEWDESPLPDRVVAYRAGMTGASTDDNQLSFEDIDGLIRLKFQPKDRHIVNTKRYPFGKGTDEHNIYAKTQGSAYYCKALRWPRSLGCPVVILTTEDLPRLVARGITGDISIKTNFTIINLTHTPHLFRDTVPLVFDERARMPRKPGGPTSGSQGSVVDLAEELLADGFDFVISDGLREIDKSLSDQVSSHRSARGRNDLQGQRIATILTYPGVQQYSDIAILGAAFDIDDPVSTALRDTVYQDLGRNLGFRYTPDQPVDAHVVVIKPSLFSNLNQLSGQSNSDLGHDRYLFQIVPSSAL